MSKKESFLTWSILLEGIQYWLGVVRILRNHFWGSRETPPFLQILSKDQTINKKLALFTWSCFKLFTIIQFILFILFIHSAGGPLLSVALSLYLIFHWLCS